MSLPHETPAERRKRLSEEIARQRVELVVAYRNMAKPFHYAETGIRGLQALRKNAWLVALMPSVVGLVFSFFGWKKKESRDRYAWTEDRRARLEAEEREAARLKKPLRKWLGRGWAAFQVYRRIRPFFP